MSRYQDCQSARGVDSRRTTDTGNVSQQDGNIYENFAFSPDQEVSQIPEPSPTTKSVKKKLTKLQIAFICATILNFLLAISAIVLLFQKNKIVPCVKGQEMGKPTHNLLQAIEEQRNDTEIKLEWKISKTETELSNVKSQLSRLMNKQSEINGSLIAMESQLSHKEAKIIEIKSYQTTLESQVSRLENESSKIKRNQTIIESQLSRSNYEINYTRNSMAVMESRLSLLRDVQSEMVRNLTEGMKRIAALPVIAPIGSTCHEIFQSGKAEASGVYTLRAGSGTFTTYCNLVDGKVITEFWHDQMGEIRCPSNLRCLGSGCYSWTPKYRIHSDYILSVIQKSRECRQFIWANCTQQRFFQESYAYWVSRDGQQMKYWGGATSERDGYCACGETGTCIRSNLKCNCDANDGNTVVDEGYLTNKSKLPVRELRFGDLDDSNEVVWHKLGKLECWGEA